MMDWKGQWKWLLGVAAAFLLLFGMKHPAIYDETPLGTGRIRLAWVALVLLVLCFMLAPLQTNGAG